MKHDPAISIANGTNSYADSRQAYVTYLSLLKNLKALNKRINNLLNFD